MADLVYSTDGGDRRRKRETQPEPDGGDGIVRVSLEKTGRRGKAVTLVSGVPPADLARVAGELKRRCGAGGSVKGGVVEIQGDHRETVAAHLEASGLRVRTRR